MSYSKNVLEKRKTIFEIEKENKQTAVELLIEQIKSKADNLTTNTKENRMAKGIYVDCLIMAKEAKEMEKQQQGYSEEEVNSIFYAICKHSFFEDNVETVYLQDVKDEFKQFKNK